MDIVIRLHPSLDKEIEARSAEGSRLSRLIEQAVRVVARHGPEVVYARIASRRAGGADHAMSARRLGRNCVMIEIDAADSAVTSRLVVPGKPAARPVRPRRP